MFVAVAQEETGLVGMKALDEQWKDRALAFVDVLGDGHSVIYGAITIHWWKVVASGPGGHSLNGGVPNVNQGIGRAVDRILQLPQPEQYQADRVVVNVATDASQVRSPMSTARTRTLVLATLVVALTASSRAQEQAPTWPREAEAPSTPRPPAPPAEVFGLVGEYESAAAGGAKPVHLYVIERDGRVMTIVDRGTPVAVDAAVPKPVFTRDARGRAATVTVGKVVYSRLLVGPEAGGQLRVTPVRSVPDVLKASQTLAPPAEAGDFLPSDLVELTTLEPGIKLDVRYATTNNFLGSVFYAEARAFLQRPAAAAVVRVHRTLAALGYGLLVHDGYRPWYVTKTFWETTPADRKWLVASPNPGSRHNRGAAVDLTLYDLKTGAVVEMPSTYDESTPRAYAFYPGGTSLQRWHRALLRRVMEAEGFAVNPEEWWHFDYQDWRRYAVGNVAFDKIPVPRTPGARNAHRRVAPARVLTAVPAAG